MFKSGKARSDTEKQKLFLVVIKPVCLCAHRVEQKKMSLLSLHSSTVASGVPLLGSAYSIHKSHITSCWCTLTYSQSLHLTQCVESLRSGEGAAASQGFENAVESQQVGLNFLLIHLVQQLLHVDI